MFSALRAQSLPSRPCSGEIARRHYRCGRYNLGHRAPASRGGGATADAWRPGNHQTPCEEENRARRAMAQSTGYIGVSSRPDWGIAKAQLQLAAGLRGFSRICGLVVVPRSAIFLLLLFLGNCIAGRYFDHPDTFSPERCSRKTPRGGKRCFRVHPRKPAATQAVHPDADSYAFRHAHARARVCEPSAALRMTASRRARRRESGSASWSTRGSASPFR